MERTVELAHQGSVDNQEPHAVAGPTTDSGRCSAPPHRRGGGISCAYDSPFIFFDLWSDCPCSSFFNLYWSLQLSYLPVGGCRTLQSSFEVNKRGIVNFPQPLIEQRHL